ncbi:hypothetical protein ACLOJK_032073 [Asimina triloba]
MDQRQASTPAAVVHHDPSIASSGDSSHLHWWTTTHRRSRATDRPPTSRIQHAHEHHARRPHKLLPRSSQRAWIERSRPHIMHPSCWPYLYNLTSPISPSPSPSSDARTLLLESAIAPLA